jgi:hypothetical protein
VTRTADAARLCAQRRLAQDLYAALDSVGRTLLSQVRLLQSFGHERKFRINIGGTTPADA